MNNEDQVKIRDIFILPHEVRKCSILGIAVFDLDSGFKERINKELHLTHIDSDNPKGSVCYAFDSDLTPAYRDTYTKFDIICYILSFYQNSRIDTTNEVLFSEDAHSFWIKVKEGNDFYIKLQNVKA